MPASPWRPALVALGLVWLLLGALYADTVIAMVAIWNGSETFAHAFLVPPIALWLVWRRREALARLTPQPQPWVLLAMAAFTVLWLLGELVVVNAAMQFAWVALVVLSVPAVLGFQVARAILFPLLFLFFAVPMGEFLLEPMMQWTADFTVAALSLSGIPVYREGLQFVIPSGSWSVVEACSGVRYLIASFMVGTVFAHLNYRSAKRQALFMVVAILVPVIANWVRAYMIVMLGHLSGNTIAVGVDHLIYGWVFFGVVVMIMFLVGARWAEPDADLAGADAGVRLLPANPAPRPVSSLVAVAVGALAVGLLPHAVLAGLHRLEGAAAAPQLALPQALSESWQEAPASTPAAKFTPVFVNPAASARQAYAGVGGTVYVYLAYYRNQSADSKLVTSVNTLVRSNDRDWNQVATGAENTVVDGRSVGWHGAQVLASRHAAGERAQLTVWRAYWINGRWVAGDIRAKLSGALARLQGRGDEGAAVVLWTDNESRPAARALLQGFVRDNLGALDSLLARTRDTR
jgi:exosortase A